MSEVRKRVVSKKMVLADVPLHPNFHPKVFPRNTTLAEETPKTRTRYIRWVFRYAGDHYGANRNSGREISNSGPEMCTHHIVV